MVLPGGELFDTEFAFYVHVSSLFKVSLQVHHEVLFSQLALSVVPEHFDCTDVWHNVIKGNIELRLYDEAYAALMTTPYDKLCVDWHIDIFFILIPLPGGANAPQIWCIACAKTTLSRSSCLSTLLTFLRRLKTHCLSRPGMLILGYSHPTLRFCIRGMS